MAQPGKIYNMAVSFNKIPKGQVFAKDPIRFQLASNNYVVSLAVKPMLILAFSGNGCANGNQIALLINGVTINLFFGNTTPTNEAQAQQNYLCTQGNFASVSAWLDYLVEALNNNFLLKSYFDITRASANGIILTSKNNYIIQGIVFMQNCNHTTFNTVANAVYRSNYLMLMDVFVEKNYRQGDFEKIATIEHEPDANSQAWFDIAPFILPYLGCDVPPIDTTGIAAGLASQMQKRYNVVAYEQSGNPPVFSTVVQANHTRGGYAQRGGFSFLAFKKDYSFFINQNMANQLWQSWASPKPTLTTQPEYLFFRKMANNITRVRLTLTYQDGSTDVFNNYFSSIDFSDYVVNDIIWISAGYSQLNIDGVKDANKKVSKYSLQLCNASNLSLYAAFEFVIDHRHYVNKRTLVFQNSWGAVETLMLKGNAKRQLITEAVDFTKTLAVGYDAQAGQENTFDERSREAIEVATGYYSKAYIDYLRELLHNNQYVWLIENGRYVKVNVVAGSYDLADDESYLYALNLKLRYAHSNHSYTDLNKLNNATGSYTVAGPGSDIIMRP